MPAASGGMFLAAAVFRFLALNGFPNDQYEHLAGAQQMLFGEWPTKDFLDPGMPLMYAVSAAAQLLLGRTLFAEAALNASAFGLAAACTLAGAYRVSRSLAIAAAVAVLAVLIFPRPYAYPRVLVTAVGPLAMWAFASRPTLPRMAGLAATVVIAFLFRHDYAAYVGVGAFTTLIVTPADGWRQRLTRVVIFGVLVVLMLAPYILFLGGPGAFADSIRSFLAYGGRHTARTALDLRNLGTASEARLFYGFQALPFAVLAWLTVDRIRRRAPAADTVLMLPLAVLAIAANYFLIRDPLSERLPDAVVPNMLAFAWLAGRALRAAPLPARWVAIAVVAIAGVVGADAVVAVGHTPEQLDRTGLLDGGIPNIAGLLGARTAELTDRFSDRQVPDGRIIRLFPFIEYLDRCSTIRHRLFVAGYAPEVFVYAHRMFAGGQKVFLDGSFASVADQQGIVDRMRRQVVLFAMLHTDDVEQWRAAFPQVDVFVESQFTPMTEIPVSSNRTVRVLVNPSIPPVGVDAVTRWPCYR